MIKMQITPLRPVETLRAQEVEPLLLANNSHAKLGLVRGAVIPTCEFMWSVLVFVRFGFILGQTGLLATIGLTAFCALVAFLTASSIAAIATNGVHRIMEGGIYRILEQSLGHGFGGSIALLYFIGLMLLTGIEIVGSVQSVFKTTASSITLTHSHYWDQVLVSVGTLILCVGVTLTGRKTVHILAFAFLIVLGLSFLSLIVGLATAVRFNHPLSIGTLRSNLYPPRTELHPIPDFAELITLLMPCFVGLYSGVNNARQLKNPNKSIPRGMFVAIGVSLALYVALFLLFAASIDRKTLLEDTLVGVKMGWPVWWLLVPAIYLVGFGASLQLLLVASAVLHSLSAELFPWTHHIYLHHKIKDEPKPATLLTAALILPLLFIPELEELATLTTMCFLMCYGTTNLACALLSTFNSPEWRPKYSIVSTQHLYLVSFSGFLLCLGVMLQISWHATVGAIMLVCLVAYSVQTSSGTWSWGSGLNGLIFYLTLRHLLASEQEMFRFQLNRYWNASADVEDQAESSTQRQGRTGEKIIWRPQIVAFLEPLDRQSHTAYRLLAFISQMKARNRSLSVFVRVITLESEKLRFKQMISDQHHSRSPSSLSRPIPIPSIDQLTNDHRVRSYQDLARSDRKKLRDRLLLEQKLILQQAMNDQIVEGFAKVIIAPTVLVGQRIFLQSMGLGELTPNMVIVNWPERLELEARDTEPKPDGDVRGHEMSEEADARALLEMQALWSMTRRMGLSMAICKGIGGFPSNDELAYGTIDVWWVVEDGQLLLLIAYLLKQSEVWEGCRLRLFALCHTTDSMEALRRELNVYLQILRIRVDSIIIIPMELVNISDEGPQDETAPNRRLRDRLMARKMQNELFKEVDLASRPLSSTDVNASASSSSNMSSDTAGNRKWKTRPSIEWLRAAERSMPEGQELFVNTNVIHQLKRALEHHSSNAALVILNLPQPEDEEWDNAHEQTAIYMEMVEWVTELIGCCMLVYAGTDVSAT